MILMDGRATAADIKNEVALRVTHLRERGLVPGLGTILVGNDPGSRVYVDAKHRDCEEVGIRSLRIELPTDARTEDVLAAVRHFNEAPSVTGFIVQLPLPEGCDTDAVINEIAPEKDVDGLHQINVGNLARKSTGELPSPIACTPRGIVELGKRHGVNWDGAVVCVIGQGQTAGRPLSLLLTHEEINSTVISCHIGTRDLAAHTRTADVVVAAAGSAGLVTPDMIKPGAAVFDVGVTRKQNEEGKSKLVGDVDLGVRELAGYFSPNPGGVGPMTRAMLLVNVVEAMERKCE
ncbi:methylenetetrahydrofolate dehydrogenase (NADP+)/methenyltetrahydrofolate cyclohydrolase [Trueperella bonasi]|uniref:Bifunctional protein FolD n=1 Tax=Trueperella bonasi TaxID=312286 RepID=A0ABT9NEM7_9ACTO|nr:tetrahydrofolate dehydrogenase/cyclohydrolase catalytic domain-containing protein [Trueperella bonasi]MDP9805799.1 methylenetetrahydrofolate dehydrogenase (NADP+)/methenyltetrahydrofolate cyclohydrolase [Trueperella bonasi]